jgi:hypothetical protein
MAWVDEATGCKLYVWRACLEATTNSKSDIVG